MPCEHFQDALTEAAVTGAEPRDELRAHLKGCGECRAAFEQERSLFASIDSGIRVLANAEVPPSFLPRVRAQLDEVQAPRRHWMSPLIFATASVAFALAVFLVTWPRHSRSDNQAEQASLIPASQTPGMNARQLDSGPSAPIVSSRVKNFQSRSHSTLLHAVASSQPEVLVPPDEREAFSRFVTKLQERGGVVLALVTSPTDEKGGPARLEQLRIKQLEVKPLEGKESEASDAAENIR